ncbi:CU044_2847 family protein [Roseibium sp. M-1]
MPVASYQSASGSKVLVEIETPEKGGARLVSKSKDGFVEARGSFEEAVEGIKPIADKIIAAIGSLAKTPKETEVSFGVKFTGEVGVILAKSSLDATLNIKLKW